MWNKLKKRKYLIGLQVLIITAIVATMTFIGGITLQNKPPGDDIPSISMGEKVIVVGNLVYAAGTPDYNCDGVDDDVQFQLAIDALPANGGKIIALAGNYSFSNAVTRAIDNVTIVGMGRSTSIARDGVNPIFTTGVQSDWTFINIRFDAGGVNDTGASHVIYENVYVGATYSAYDTSTDITADEWAIPVGRGTTFVVAASNADVQSIAQADYVCDGTDDDVQINAAITALPATGGKVILSEGTFAITAPIVIPPYVSLQGMLLAGYSGATLRSTTIQNTAGGGSDAIRVNVGGAISVGAEIKDLSVIGNALSGIGINVENVPWMRISNVRVYGHGGIGIQLSGCWWGGISDSIVQHNGGIGIVLTGDSHSWVTRCEIGDNTTRNLYIVDSSEYCLIEDNWFENAALTAVENLRVWNSRWARIIGNVMCVKDTAVLNIYIGGDAGEGSKFALILDNLILDASRGVYITSDYGSDAIIAENEFRNIGIAALHIAGDRCQIENNKIGDAAHTVGGVTISGERCIFSGNRIYNNTGTALSLGATAIYTVVEGNIIEGGAEHGILCSGNHTTIGNNIIQGQTNHGINIFRASYCTITGNVSSGNGFDGIEVFGDGVNNADFNVVTSNVCNGNTGSGIEVIGSSNANQNILADNQLSGNTAADLIDNGVDNTVYAKYSNLLMDVLAVTANHVRNNEDLSAGIPITFTIDAQPDVPRTLSGHFDSHVNITAYTIDIIGVDGKGITLTETMTDADGWDWETNNAFATITSITMSARTGTGVGDTMDIGITDVLGLSNAIYATGDVYKIKKNNANATVAGAQVNTTYATYDMAVIGLAATDDFTIWFRSNLNIVS